MRRNASMRRRWEETRSERREDSTTRIDHPVEEEIQENAKDLLLHLLKRSGQSSESFFWLTNAHLSLCHQARPRGMKHSSSTHSYLTRSKRLPLSWNRRSPQAKSKRGELLPGRCPEPGLPFRKLRSTRRDYMPSSSNPGRPLGEPFEKWNNLVLSNETVSSCRPIDP